MGFQWNKWTSGSSSRKEDVLELKIISIKKTEVFKGPKEGQKNNMVRTTPWDPLQVANIQEKYGWKPGESETEHFLRMSLSGAGRILLDGSETDGYGGPGVLLNLGPELINQPHSIISRVAYWAGETEVMERARPASYPFAHLMKYSPLLCMDTNVWTLKWIYPNLPRSWS